jgi:hypothetical protein
MSWIISGILLAASLWCIVGNYWIAFSCFVTKKSATAIPFVGGILGMIGLLLLPSPGWSQFWWVPPIVDLGCVPLIGATVVHLLRRKASSKP